MLKDFKRLYNREPGLVIAFIFSLCIGGMLLFLLVTTAEREPTVREGEPLQVSDEDDTFGEPTLMLRPNGSGSIGIDTGTGLALDPINGAVGISF